jgi:hypothetical protein
MSAAAEYVGLQRSRGSCPRLLFESASGAKTRLYGLRTPSKQVLVLNRWSAGDRSNNIGFNVQRRIICSTESIPSRPSDDAIFSMSDITRVLSGRNNTRQETMSALLADIASRDGLAWDEEDGDPEVEPGI